MRSTRIWLAASAALAALGSPTRRKALFVLAVAGLLAIVAGCSGGGDAAKNDSLEPSQDVFARAGGWIAFRSGSKIVAVDPENPKDTLVLGLSLDDDPIAWSSDGSKLLLRSHQEDYAIPFPGLFVLHPDGSRTTLVREIPLDEPIFPGSRATWGSFSPDGTEVVYGAHRSPGPFIIDANGGKPRPLGDRCDVLVNGLVVDTCGEGNDAAAWSPDGSKILWFDFIEGGGRAKPYEDDCPIRECGHRAVLSSINPDGTGRKLGVAPLPGEGASSLVWSPDGSRLAFWLADDADLNAQIFVINADGSSLQQITRDGDNRWPAWSSDGSRIAFVRNGTLFTMTPDGTDMREVRGAMPDGAIAWSPAG